MYRKPNGEYTDDIGEMAKAWRELAAPIEKATGWKLYAFNPDLAFRAPPTRSWQNVQIPVEFAHALSNALKKEE